jgi:hypothetical protein
MLCWKPLKPMLLGKLSTRSFRGCVGQGHEPRSLRPRLIAPSHNCSRSGAHTNTYRQRRMPTHFRKAPLDIDGSASASLTADSVHFALIWPSVVLSPNRVRGQVCCGTPGTQFGSARIIAIRSSSRYPRCRPRMMSSFICEMRALCSGVPATLIARPRPISRRPSSRS